MAAYVFLESVERTGVCAGESCCRSIVEKPEDSVSVARVGCEYVVQASGCGVGSHDNHPAVVAPVQTQTFDHQAADGP